MEKDIRIGDMVEIINYGHLVWENKAAQDVITSFPLYKKCGDIVWYDINPKLIGKQGVIIAIGATGEYTIDRIGSWYSEEQLKVIKKGVNHE